MHQDAMRILHQDLPREGPGDDAYTKEALHRLPPLPVDPVVIDLGCGPGRQTLVLATELKTRILAVDIHQPFLDQLNRRATAHSLSHLIETHLMDMGALEMSSGSADLIWSEGAAYILGFEESLRRWLPLLKPKGLMAVTECTWLTDSPPEEVKTFWDAGYPEMRTVEENRRRIQTCGLEVIDTFVLPETAWWNEYYIPMLKRIEILRPTADANLTLCLHEAEQEIELFRRHSDSYGYVFYLLQRSRL